VASDEQLGLLCVLRPRRFGPGDEELLRALADQTAMGLERADLIARLTARDRVKDLFDGLAGGAADAAVLAAAPAGCDLSRPHVFLHGEPAATANGGRVDWEGIAGRLAGRLRGRDQPGFFDAGGGGLRAVVADARHGRRRARDRRCDASRRPRASVWASAPRPRNRREPPGAARGRAAAQIARTLRSPTAARSATSSSAPTSTSSTCAWKSPPRDRHWTASRRCWRTTASAAPRCWTRSR
jgi:hypothetical protein